MGVSVNEWSSETESKKIRSPSCSWGIGQTPLALPFLPVPPLPRSDHLFRFLHSLASQNPIFNKLASLSAQFHSLCVKIGNSRLRNTRTLSTHNFAAVLPGDSVAGLVVSNGILNFLNVYNTLLIVRLVLTWFPNSPPAIVSPLSTICDPYLNIFRGLIPPLGGTLDLSPILAFLVLNVFTSTAAALPAELPLTQQSQQGLAAPLQSQKKWIRRLQGNSSRTSARVN